LDLEALPFRWLLLAFSSPLPVTIIFSLSPRKKNIRPRQHDHSRLASLLLHGREFNNGPLDSKV
jgi:hypothetical protein